MTPLFAHKHSGDRAFERLYRAHVQDVYRYSLMVLRNPADAEDVAQTTFLKAYRAFQRGDRPRHARQWLITIAHNTCRTRLRDAKRRPNEVVLDEGVVGSSSVRTEEDVDVRELVRALEALAFNQRSALVMRELEGRSYAEIAEVLNVSSTAVETLLFRARRALREQLEGPLTCGEAERALSLQLDGRLPQDERAQLRAHLRECAECSSLARRQRARRAALRGLGPLPLPASLASWGGGAVGAGVAAKVAALVAASVVAVGAGNELAEADANATAPRATKRATPAAVAIASSGTSTPPVSASKAARPATRPRAEARLEKNRPTRAHVGVVNGAAAGRPTPEQASAPQQAPVPAVTVPSVAEVVPDLPQVEPPPLPVEVPPVSVEVPPVPVPPLPPLPQLPLPPLP